MIKRRGRGAARICVLLLVIMISTACAGQPVEEKEGKNDEYKNDEHGNIYKCSFEVKDVEGNTDYGQKTAGVKLNAMNTIVLNADGTYEYTKLTGTLDEEGNLQKYKSGGKVYGTIELRYIFAGEYEQEGDRVTLAPPTDCTFAESWGNLTESAGMIDNSGTASEGSRVHSMENVDEDPLDYFEGFYYWHNGHENSVVVTVNDEDGTFTYVESANVNARYDVENVEALSDSPLSGKRICYLGSSVTYGARANGVSFVEFISARNSCDFVKEAVSGTTLVEEEGDSYLGENSYIRRMLNNISTNEKFDAFVCQLSTNDATKKLPLGEISASKDLDAFDTKTIIGAMEYIIVYAMRTWDCPVIFYTGTKYESEEYQKMVEALLKLQEKYEIGVINLWDDAEMNAVSDRDYIRYMYDPVHPTKEGYLDWWTPKMEECLYELLALER